MATTKKTTAATAPKAVVKAPVVKVAKVTAPKAVPIVKKIVAPRDAYLYAYSKDGVQDFPDNWYITEHFTWDEVFANEVQSDGCPTLEIFETALQTAHQMEHIRVAVNKPINVHCWVRQIPHNIRAGSTAEFSPHINGRAVDFDVEGLSIEDAIEVILKLKTQVRIERRTTDWVHIDIGNSYIGAYAWGMFNP